MRLLLVFMSLIPVTLGIIGTAPIADAALQNSSQTRALGGASRTHCSYTDAIYQNPSQIGFFNSFSFGGVFTSQTASGKPEFGASIVDGGSQMFSAGVGWSKTPDLHSDTNITVALGRSVYGPYCAWDPREEGGQGNKPRLGGHVAH